MKSLNLKLLSTTLAILLVGVVSYFILCPMVNRSSYIDDTIRALDQSKEVVMTLATSSTAVSIAVTLLPDDAATPVAEKITDLSALLLIVLCTIYLEKFLVSISGVIVFRIMVPIVCFGAILWFLTKREAVKSLTIKFGIFAAGLLIIIPVSVKVSLLVQSQYENAINLTIESATYSAEKMQEGTADVESGAETTTSIYGQVLGKLKETGDIIASGANNMTDYLKKLMGNLLDAVALLLVTTCIIPLITALIIIWLVKILFGVNMVSGVSSFEKSILAEIKKGRKEMEHEERES